MLLLERKVEMKVKQILKLMPSDEKVNVIIYAYGVYYASTFADGMDTAEECIENMNYTCANSYVKSISSRDDEYGHHYIRITSEIVKEIV